MKRLPEDTPKDLFIERFLFLMKYTSKCTQDGSIHELLPRIIQLCVVLFCSNMKEMQSANLKWQKFGQPGKFLISEQDIKKILESELKPNVAESVEN